MRLPSYHCSIPLQDNIQFSKTNDLCQTATSAALKCLDLSAELWEVPVGGAYGDRTHRFHADNVAGSPAPSRTVRATHLNHDLPREVVQFVLAL